MLPVDQRNPTRRRALQWMAAGAIAVARNASAGGLPLVTTGLEHIGMTVPDQEAAAKFYGLIFDPQLFQERDPPPRFYTRIGISYIAFGGIAANAPNQTPRIDHFCTLVPDYNAQETRKAIDAAAIPMSGNGPIGMALDPDGIRLQLLGVPGGLAKSIIPNRRISQDEPAVQAVGFDQIVLNVTDLEKSAAHYRKFFGMEMPRTRKETISFALARTRLVLEPVSAGKAAGIDRIVIKVAGFDHKAVTEKLKKLNVNVIASNEKDAVRFKDLNGFVMELKGTA